MYLLHVLTAILFFFNFTKAHTDIKQHTTSLIVPCCPKHAPHLVSLLRVYEYQTEIPDEVIISLSESPLIAPEIITQLTEELWSFPVVLLLHEQKVLAGQNRNHACKKATGDILICQDADDLPHPQRIEIIKYFFNTYKIDHLMHKMQVFDPHHIYNKQAPRLRLNKDGTMFFKYYSLESTKFFFPKNFDDVWKTGIYTNGNIAISRELFKKVHWGNEPRGQDTLFNKKIFSLPAKSIVIKLPLYIHFPSLSSLHDDIQFNRPPYPLDYSLDKIKQYKVQIYTRS